jgi:hypothetical protein
MTVIAAPATVVPRYSETPRRHESDWIVNLILYMPLIGVTFLAKIGFQLGSEIIIGVPMILSALLLGIFTGRLKPHPRRFAVYLMVMAIMVGLQVFAAPTFVPSSLSLVLLVPLAASFELHGAGVDSTLHQRRILDFALFFCLLGIVQYLAQYAIGQRLAYPIDNFGPRGGFIAITKNYNALIPIKYGATTLKANGVFLLEPSYYSQTLAAGFAMEASGPRRLKRLACFCAGFVVAYSGTGLLMLFPTLAVLIIAEKRFDIMGYLMVAGVVMLAFAKPLGLEVFLDRATEFESTRSSGYMRYVGGIHLFDQYLWPHPQRALFGMGSGMMFRSTPWPQFFVAETGWVKILIEFGIVGFVTYFGFLFYCIFSSRQPLAVRACVAVTPLLSGILDPWSHALMLGLLVWMPPRADYVAKGEPMRVPHPLDLENKRPPVEATATSAPVSPTPSPRRQPMPGRTRTQLGHGPRVPPGKRLPH